MPNELWCSCPGILGAGPAVSLTQRAREACCSADKETENVHQQIQFVYPIITVFE